MDERSAARRAVVGLLAPVALVFLWAAVAAGASSALVPGPVATARRFAELAGPVLAAHTAASLARVLAALAAATVSAVPLGILIGRIRAAREGLTPLVYLLYPVPKIALLPLVFVFIGVGEGARVVLVWLVLFFQVLVAVRDAAATVPQAYQTALTALGGGRAAHVRYVILPAILPALLTALRIGSGTSLAVLFFAETFFTNRGLGFFIVDNWMKSSYVDMTAGILAIGLLGLALFSVLDFAQRRLCRWQRV
jgi:NitT/TauT family transport system permease protein